MQRAREGRDCLTSDLHLEVPGWSLGVPELDRNPDAVAADNRIQRIYVYDL